MKKTTFISAGNYIFSFQAKYETRGAVGGALKL